MRGVGAPSVMVSSTYYDLRQVRADLEQFIGSDLGYTPLLSEFPSFPVDPDRKTVENCGARVQQHVDVLVLVIGGRYGQVNKDSKKSVTNLEYLTARAKGIPVYAFVEKRTLTALPLWEMNPDGDFSVVVDNTGLFEFVRDVRSKDGVWTFEFETAQDIVTALRHQFAYQMLKGLLLTARIRASNLPESVQSLGGRAFMLAIEKPDAWEYKLLSQVVADEIEGYKELKQRYVDKIALGQAERVSMFDIQAWSAPRIHEMQQIANALNHTINVRAQEALGAPGEPGDVEKIVAVGRLIGEAYREALEWSLRVRRTAGHERLVPIIDAMAQFPEDLLAKVEMLGKPLLRRIEKALSVDATDEDRIMDIMLRFDISHYDEFEAALDNLTKNIDLGEVDLS